MQDLLKGLLGRELGCPRPARMKNIPSRPFHRTPPCAGVMVAKTIYNYVPDRLIVLYQETLCQRNPNWDNDKIATREVIQFQVLHLFDILGMLL